MNIHVPPSKFTGAPAPTRRPRPDFDCVALLLQGGGALGAYQAGVYHGLAEADLHPDWVAGISIGAINSAIIAGNAPETRMEKLRGFWELITTDPLWSWSGWGGAFGPEAWAAAVQPRGDLVRGLANQVAAGRAAAVGAPGFFAPHTLSPWLQEAGTPQATSYYDTAMLRGTLERFVDFDRINAGETRLSVGAVNVATGNFVYFDSTTHEIGPEHVMASGALPPGFPGVEIAGEFYWDGGVVSNTPLQWVIENEPRQDTLAFQVDLWNARGALPRTMSEVVTRQKEIQYSSRTRAGSDRFKTEQRLRNALADLLARLPDELRDTAEYRTLQPVAERKVYNLIQMIYRSERHEGGSKDFDFSRQSMQDHWVAGYHETIRALRDERVLERPKNAEGVAIFDLATQGRE
jgi:NTE family protein